MSDFLLHLPRLVAIRLQLSIAVMMSIRSAVENHMPASDFDEVLLRIQNQLDKMKKSLRVRRSNPRTIQKDDPEIFKTTLRNPQRRDMTEKDIQRH